MVKALPLLFVVCLLSSITFIILSTWAAFPGENGKIAFQSPFDGDYEIFVMNPDGSSVTQLISIFNFDANLTRKDFMYAILI